ncbi:flavoprotein-like protein [Schizothecium vesticola]|uniref:Flavoprotein-like protein n=1 Tax=Schizothecium vesticola TaxID=314040 RepID=A0AA40K934_9PEZI|nr:flavoprotein-like protein [Schizothecium vesticola]
MTKSVALITMSTRAPRAGPHVAALVKSILDPEAKANDITLVPVDLADFKLPVYDEAVIPGMVDTGKPDAPVFAHAHSIAWSTTIKAHDAYVLVLNEYNYGLPGGAKNAIDYLLNQWKGKPVAIVTYGIKGGAFASEQGAHVLGMMGLKVAETRPQLQFKGGLGPEAFAAMLQGEVGEEQLGLWRSEKGADVKKAFEEVAALLKEEKSV